MLAPTIAAAFVDSRLVEVLVIGGRLFKQPLVGELLGLSVTVLGPA